MVQLKIFRKANNLTQIEVAEFLGIGKSFISRIESGSVGLPEDKLIKLLNNDRGWDVSMLKSEMAGKVSNNINSVVNSHNFRYDSGISATEFLAFAQENQRQMGQLIDTIATLTKKIN